MTRSGTSSAADFLPEHRSLDALREAADVCQGCALYQDATQTVFGEGSADAKVVFIGEQPGDEEDRAGRPFVGPAGRLLDRAMVDAGIDRRAAYITNAVKHFKWEPRGKRRIHKKPQDREIKACKPWLAAEIELIRPQVVVCLGVTAATAAFGKAVRLKDHRGRFVATPLCDWTFVTTHPSALLRLQEADLREAEYQRLVEDLQQVQTQLHEDAR
ncbi:MAG: UdgX family uracil-DNA binding protein [Gammaproteobacteria bacterium]